MTLEEALCLLTARRGVPIENYKVWEELHREAENVVDIEVHRLVNKRKEGK